MSAMILKLKRGTGVDAFMNKGIFYAEGKAVTLDRVLTNLFMKIYTGNQKYTPAHRGEYTIEELKGIINLLEEAGELKGAKENPEAVEDWLRSSLLELVNRGNVVKEHIATLKPLHLLSFRVQNVKFCKDYRASEQLYLMLNSSPEVMNGLRKYLGKGYDKETKSIVTGEKLDVDTTGLIHIANTQKQRKTANTEIEKPTEPFLKKQTELFNDDIRRLLLYKDKLPRAVFIDYLRILCGFHLCLYIMKVIYLLPKMVSVGTRDIEDDWSMVVDLTDNLDSVVAPYACRDVERMENSFGQYIRSTYMADIVQKRLKDRGVNSSIDEVLRILKNDTNRSAEYFEIQLAQIRSSLPDKDEKEFDREDFDEMLQYFPKDDFFGKLVHVLEKSNLGTYQYKYLKNFIDKVSMKNSPSMLLADSRSVRHPRRGVIGSKLLETMVQLLVLREKSNGQYETHSLSIDELAAGIRDRYGIIINGLNEPRFADGDVAVNNAFHENMEALKNKLRQIGFYTDMSDACILQKIRPRYNLDN